MTIKLPAQARSADHEQVTRLIDWIGSAWLAADAYGGLREAYEAICRTRARRKQLFPTEDDTKPPEPVGGSRRRGLSEDQIRQLRTFDNFWIEAGALGANLGRGIPGNQLDMTRFTRVFFGSPVEDVPPNSDIDDITLIWDGDVHSDRTLKFGDNGMDKLNVPPAGDRGPEFYRGRTLLFTRQADGAFGFTVGSDADKAIWHQRSQHEGVVHHVGRRAWGLF